MTASIFDGRAIDQHAVKFTGTADIDQALGSEVHQNDIVTAIVTGVVKRSTLDTTKDDLLKRTNTVTVRNTVLLTPEQFEQVQVALAMGDADLSTLFKDIELPPPSEDATDGPDDGPVEPDWNN